MASDLLKMFAEANTFPGGRDICLGDGTQLHFVLAFNGFLEDLAQLAVGAVVHVDKLAVGKDHSGV